MNINAWATPGHAQGIGDIIAIKPTSIIVLRPGASPLSAQTVRLETLSGQQVVQGDNGETHMISALALGYKGHPTIADTNLQAADRFFAGGTSYEVVMIAVAMIDNLQAYLKVRG